MEHKRNHEISDLETAVLGLGAEVEALNMTLRELLPPLFETEVEPPAWVNSASRRDDPEPADPQLRSQLVNAAKEAPRDRQRMGSGAAYVVLAAIVGSVLTAAFLLYVIGN